MIIYKKALLIIAFISQFLVPLSIQSMNMQTTNNRDQRFNNSLIHAIWENNTHKAYKLIFNNIGTKATTLDGDTPLMCCIDNIKTTHLIPTLLIKKNGSEHSYDNLLKTIKRNLYTQNNSNKNIINLATKKIISPP